MIILPLLAHIHESPREAETDSWGNVCGHDNRKNKITKVQFSGKNMTSQPYLFLFQNTVLNGVIDQNHSNQKHVRLCVRKCLNKITTCQQVFKENGYFNLTENLLSNKACFQPYQLVLPQYEIRKVCKPKIISLVSNLLKNIKFINFF